MTKTKIKTRPHIYNADPVTGEFISTGQADTDPLTKGEFLVPAHAYLDKPPSAGDGEAVIRNGDEWKIVPDNRGKTVYHKVGGFSETVKKLGDIDAEFTLIPRPSMNHDWNGIEWVLNNDKAWISIRAERNSKLSFCDWTQLADAPLSEAQKTAWATYRQALRDITETAKTPDDIVWPEEPTE